MPEQSAYARALAFAEMIRAHGYGNMGVTMSWGCEYCNSEDVLVPFPPGKPMPAPPTTTVEDLIKQVQHRLNELGATPKLVEDGKLGPLTLNAILTALRPVIKT